MANILTADKVGSIAYEFYANGDHLESVSEDEALEYLHGWENIPPGLENVLEGKAAGFEFDVTLTPADGHGEYDEDLIEEIPRDQFDFDEEDADLEPGIEVEMMDEGGDIYEGVVQKIEGDHVIVDFNPPLAGKTLRYVGKVVNVREATETELEWGIPESLVDVLLGDDDFDEEDDD